MISEDGNYLTKYFIAVEDVNYTISFNLNINYQSGPNTITNIIDLMNNQDKLELFRDSGLVDEVMFIHFKNLSEAEPSYITSIDSIINQMTAIYRFNNLTSDGSGNEVSKSYYNYRFARNTGGTDSFELILHSGYAYQLEITDARGNEVVHGSLFEYENCFYVKSQLDRRHIT